MTRSQLVFGLLLLPCLLAASRWTDAPSSDPAVRILEEARDALRDTRQLDVAAEQHRALAHERDLARTSGPRLVQNLALDAETALVPSASSAELASPAILAVDGDESTAWRATGDIGPWTWTLPFSRVVHLGLVRALFGDSAEHGVPWRYRWELQIPVAGRCVTSAAWVTPPGGAVHDRDPNTFVYGAREVHAQRQALFLDRDVCALRLTIDDVEIGAPVLREVRLLESARSLTDLPGVMIAASSTSRSGGDRSAAGAIDGTYAQEWIGDEAARRWRLRITLPEARVIDRIRLLTGHDTITVERDDQPGRAFSASLAPTDYEIRVAPDDDETHLEALPESRPPLVAGLRVPIRRRLVHFSPRPAKLVELSIYRATNETGRTREGEGAPAIREIGVYESDDSHPVVTEPLFLSVDANPSMLTDRLRGGERAADAQFARDAFYRLRRIVLGLDADSGWPCDAHRPRDADAGRFLDVIEGDDPSLRQELLVAMSPPPVVLLSGSHDWEFDVTSGAPTKPNEHWAWDVEAAADAPDRGMGLLRDAIQSRAAPFVGFCGGAQILALLDAQRERATILGGPPIGRPVDAILLRNDNRVIRGRGESEGRRERAWWSDPVESDPYRPQISFLPRDPLFSTGDLSSARDVTGELPVSHGDMIRMTAFRGPLRDLELVAWSRLCARWIDASGPEPTWPDPSDSRSRCVVVPQAFRSREADGYPLAGFQFHPEQRDLVRLGPGSPPEARGDALNLLANTVDWILSSYVERYWPTA